MHRPKVPTSRRILLSTVVAGAATLIPVGPALAGPTPAEHAGSDARQRQYAAAANEYGVPESILLGVSSLESRWDAPAGVPSASAGYGPMPLTDAEHVTRGVHNGPGEAPRGDGSRPALAVQ